MKLADLSYREYLAIEVLPAIVARGEKRSDEQVRAAFDIADAFLRGAHRERETHAHALDIVHRRAEAAEATVSLLRNMGDDFAPRVALEQFWETLGAKNQTEAMARLRLLVEEAGK